MKQPLQIAIDGPVAAGKGDIAERLAKRLHLIYLYTGAMYRVLALACMRNKIPTTDAPKIVELLNQIQIDFIPQDQNTEHTYKLLLNGQDVTKAIFAQDVAQASSDVSVIPEVRKIMVSKQKILAQGKAVVMEGRDIGLRVLPQSQLKIYLTASIEERTKRRLEQFANKGIKKTYQEVLEDTKKRDEQDMTRSADPLQRLPDAWELDTTSMTQEVVIEKIIQELQKRQLI